MLSKEEIKLEIQKMDSWIPIYEIEKRLNMPPTTLQKVLKGTRELPKKWNKVLEVYFIENKVSVTNANKQTQSVKNITEEKPKNKEVMPDGLTWKQQLEWNRNH